MQSGGYSGGCTAFANAEFTARIANQCGKRGDHHTECSLRPAPASRTQSRAPANEITKCAKCDRKNNKRHC